MTSSSLILVRNCHLAAFLIATYHTTSSVAFVVRGPKRTHGASFSVQDSISSSKF